MAMTTTLMPSPDLKSAFSPYTDSPSSPAPFSVSSFNRVMQRASAGSENSLHPPPSPYPATVDPSPVESNDSHSTDVTDIDTEVEDGSSEDHDDQQTEPDIEILSPSSGVSQEDVSPVALPQLNTNIADKIRAESDDAPQSVIHAPTGFKQFESKKSPPLRRTRSGSSPSQNSENTVVSPTTPELLPEEKLSLPMKGTTPINTQIPPSRHGAGSTPRASTIQEAEEEWRRRSWASSKGNLEDIEETEDMDRPSSGLSSHTSGSQVSIGDALKNLNTAEQEVTSLKSALSECWNLCNTLANLSSMHRERMFNFSGSGDMQEQAWRSCWRLCQNLYESRDEDHVSQVPMTLNLCREFCQALFEARHRSDEVTDSILRVSFELNNHLYNTHDRNLPDAFKERTLDFYLTMCHRLMKQRTSLPEETDTLLRACWGLAELLFSLRQNNRDNKPVDEELLGSAVQACWELCDIFREGWTQIRPERGTPKPTQRIFPGANFPSNNYPPNSFHATPGGSSSRPPSSLSGTFHSANSMNFPPETPTTIFDDRDDFSPTEMSVPNILVLGPDPTAMAAPASSNRNNARWSSNSSVSESHSTFSESSQRTTTSNNRSSRATPTPQQQMSSMSTTSQNTEPEDPHLLRLKALILRASVNIGFGRNSTTTLTTFVKTLPSSAFGTQPWQMKLFESYRKLVLSDPTLRGDLRANLPIGRRMTASEIARAVQWMSRSDQFSWFRDLYILIFGFDANDAQQADKKGVGIQM